MRHLLGLPRNSLFDTEYLAWKCIPRHAIIRRWSWSTVRSGFGSVYPDLGDLIPFPSPEKRTLQELRVQLCTTQDFKIEALVDHLIDQLELLPQNLTTRQVAMIILGWSRDMSRIESYDRLEANLWHLMPEKIQELDYRLYAKTCQWNIHQQTLFTRNLSPRVDHLITQMKVARNFNLQTFEDWLAERDSSEEAECKEMENAEPECVEANVTITDDETLLRILKRSGFAVTAPTFRRRPLELTPTRYSKLTPTRYKQL